MSLSICFSLKTGLLKWKPDYDGAVSEFTKAGEYVCMRITLSYCEVCMIAYNYIEIGDH